MEMAEMKNSEIKTSLTRISEIKKSEKRMSEKRISGNKELSISEPVELFLDDNSDVKLKVSSPEITISTGKNVKLSVDYVGQDYLGKITIGVESELYWEEFSSIEKTANLNVNLVGENASAKINQRFILDDGIVNQYTSVNHLSSSTTSEVKVKGVLRGKAKGDVKNTVNIPKNSAGCKGHQKADILLLSNEAKCNALPILEVENEDVECSHGVSIGKVREEELYYLQSRGIPLEKAEEIIAEGFLKR